MATFQTTRKQRTCLRCGAEFVSKQTYKRNQRFCSRLCANRANQITHGEAGGGYEHHTPEYNAWVAMKNRCYTVSGGAYPRYGARGVTVCDEWRSSFQAFLAHVGRKPSPKHTLDRIDPTGHYVPGNVRWATATEQQRNKRRSVKIYPGQRIGNLTILFEDERRNDNAMWRCRCDCGKEKAIPMTSLVGGEAVTCGCHMHLRKASVK